MIVIIVMNSNITSMDYILSMGFVIREGGQTLQQEAKTQVQYG